MAGNAHVERCHEVCVDGDLPYKCRDGRLRDDLWRGERGKFRNSVLDEHADLESVVVERLDDEVDRVELAGEGAKGEVVLGVVVDNGDKVIANVALFVDPRGAVIGVCGKELEVGKGKK